MSGQNARIFHSRHRRVSAAIVLVGWLTAGAAAATEFQFTKIADSDTSMPGTGGSFGRLYQPAIDGDVVAFRGADGTAFDSLKGLYTAAASGGALTVVADFATPVPGTMDGFYSIDAASIDAGRVAFHGTANTGPPIFTLIEDGLFSDRSGVLGAVATDATYSSFGNVAPFFDDGAILFYVVRYGGGRALVLDDGVTQAEVVSTDDAMPGAAYDFSNFGELALDGSDYAFTGISPSAIVTGVYADLGAGLVRVADTDTLVPGESFTFESLLEGVALDGGVVTFIGELTGTGLGGLFRYDGSTLTKIVDFEDASPGGALYRSFFEVSADDGRLAFFASTGVFGLFVDLGDGIEKLIDVNDTLDGKNVNQLGMGPQALSGNRIAFLAGFGDGSEGIYVAEPIATAVPGLGLWGGVLAAGGILGTALCGLRGRALAGRGASPRPGSTKP